MMLLGSWIPARLVSNPKRVFSPLWTVWESSIHSEQDHANLSTCDAGEPCPRPQPAPRLLGCSEAAQGVVHPNQSRPDKQACSVWPFAASLSKRKCMTNRVTQTKARPPTSLSPHASIGKLLIPASQARQPPCQPRPPNAFRAPPGPGRSRAHEELPGTKKGTGFQQTIVVAAHILSLVSPCPVFPNGRMLTHSSRWWTR